MQDCSKVIKHKGYRWRGVRRRAYKGDTSKNYRSVTRQTLVGEAEDERATPLITRYFEIQPGGYSSLERHEHPHTVIVVRGRGEVILGERVHAVDHLDCVYVAPSTLHQFHASSSEPLGFLCIVERERDRPVMPTDKELAALVRSPRLAKLLASR